jgi:hypothetical protein
MLRAKLRLWTSLLVLGGAALGVAYLPFNAATASAGPTFHVSQILSGASLHHTFLTSGSTSAQSESLSGPDDITRWGHELFVGFQNGVGPLGQASGDGNRDSTVVEFTLTGQVISQWDVAGKTDGLTADPRRGVLASVNEDGNSALYLIRPNAPAGDALTRFSYSETLPHGGGTDAISVDQGQILISASAPGADGSPVPSSTDPAVYSVTLDRATMIATVTPLFFDESSATVATVGTAQYGASIPLALTDPDSSEIVPHTSSRFAGDFLLTSQGDQEQIYLSGAGTSQQTLSVLDLTQSVDDTAWPTASSGSLFTTDSTNDAVDVVRGPFERNQPIVVATPCGANSAPAACTAPNYLATLNLETGVVTQVSVSGVSYVPQGGLTFVSDQGRDRP